MKCYKNRVCVRSQHIQITSSACSNLGKNVTQKTVIFRLKSVVLGSKKVLFSCIFYAWFYAET